MNPRSLAALGLVLLLSTAVWAQGPAPNAWKPKEPPAAAPTQPARHGSDTTAFLPDSAVLATVDSIRITVFNFRDRWFSSYIPDLPRNDSAGRCEFLGSMVDKEILGALARKVNRPFNFEDRAKMRESRSSLLANLAFIRLVADSSQPTPAEIQHVYDQGNYQLHVQHIASDDRAALEQARQDILAKRLTWSEAVKRYTTARDTAGPDGDVGWVGRARFDPLPALAVFDLADGQLSDIFRDADGWQLVRVVGRRPVQQPALTLLRRMVESEARRVKTIRRSEVVRSQIRRRIGMEYDSTNVVFAAAAFRDQERRQAAMAADNNALNLGGVTPDFAPADTSRVLARWQGGQITLAGYLEDLGTVPPDDRPKVGTFDAFRSSLDGFVLEPQMVDLAVQHGYDRDPLLLAELAKKEEGIRVEHLYADSIQSKVYVTKADRQKFYEAHLPNYISFQRVQFAIIGRHSKAGADSVVQRLEAGETAASILAADSLAQISSLGSIRWMREDERGEAWYKPLFEEMKPGNLRLFGPDKVGDYAVIQKLAHDPGRQLTLAEVESYVDESVQNVKSERLLHALVARHRPGHRVEMHCELVKRIRLRDPAISR